MATKRIITKLLGDAGEHYALSQFSFAGIYAAKMPDNCKSYDLAVETGAGLVRVYVMTIKRIPLSRAMQGFGWDDRIDCEWFVFILKADRGQSRSWVIPSNLVEKYSTVSPVMNASPWKRELTWDRINGTILAAYEDNWSKSTGIPKKDAVTEKET